MRATSLPSPWGAAAVLFLGLSCALPSGFGQAAPTVGMTGVVPQPSRPIAPPVPAAPDPQVVPPEAPPSGPEAAPPAPVPPAVVEGMPGQPGPETAQLPDPPARVGRLGVVQGEAQFRPAVGAEWQLAMTNLPLTSGNAVMTGQGRALLELPEGRIGLDPATRVEFQRLDDEVLALTLAEGQLMLDLRGMARGETVQVVTPRGTARIDGPGRYLVAAGAEDRPTRLGVQAGAARFLGDGLDQPLKAGEQLMLAGGLPPQPQLARFATPEPLMAWMAGFEPRAPLPQVVQGMTGAEDLIRYGQWGTHPDYGQVWYPPVDTGWAPYRNGQWAWSDPWGWNWVDAAPWGFAPFHYGRWIYYGTRWAWVPRPYWYTGMPLYRPYYSPALVSFWGGFTWGLGLGWARPVAWAPLGPGEWYRPWYNYSSRYGLYANRPYFRNLAGITALNGQTILPNQLMNHRWATAAPANAFATGTSIARVGQPFTPQMLAGARGFAGQPVAPALTTPGMTATAAQRLGLASPSLAGGAQMVLPGARPPLPAAGGRAAFAAAAMPRVAGPTGISPGGVSPSFNGSSIGSFSGRGVPSFSGAGVSGFRGAGVPAFTGRSAAPSGAGVPAFSGRSLAPTGTGIAGFGGYRAPAAAPYSGGGFRAAPAPSFTARAPSFSARGPAPSYRSAAPSGGYSAPRVSASSAPRASSSVSRPSGSSSSGSGRRR